MTIEYSVNPIDQLIKFADEYAVRNNNSEAGSLAADAYLEWQELLKLIKSPRADARAINAELLEALQEITEGKGAYSLDQLTHAMNVIEDMKQIAKDAIAKATS